MSDARADGPSKRVIRAFFVFKMTSKFDMFPSRAVAICAAIL